MGANAPRRLRIALHIAMLVSEEVCIFVVIAQIEIPSTFRTPLHVIIPQLVSGVKHIHSMGWSHRKIRADNVFVTSVNPIQVALADFGLSKELNSSLERKVDRHGVTDIILTDPW
jgi:hypothetical protein